MEWTLTRILGRFIKAGICRVAAYLNHRLKRIARKSGSRLARCYAAVDAEHET
jgi:hypothetical protein